MCDFVCCYLANAHKQLYIIDLLIKFYELLKFNYYLSRFTILDVCGSEVQTPLGGPCKATIQVSKGQLSSAAWCTPAYSHSC